MSEALRHLFMMRSIPCMRLWKTKKGGLYGLPFVFCR